MMEKFYTFTRFEETLMEFNGKQSLTAWALHCNWAIRTSVTAVESPPVCLLINAVLNTMSKQLECYGSTAIPNNSHLVPAVLPQWEREQHAYVRLPAHAEASEGHTATASCSYIHCLRFRQGSDFTGEGVSSWVMHRTGTSCGFHVSLYHSFQLKKRKNLSNSFCKCNHYFYRCHFFNNCILAAFKSIFLFTSLGMIYVEGVFKSSRS